MAHLAKFWKGPQGKRAGISYRAAMVAAKKTYTRASKKKSPK